jgi:nitric oxide reductase NorE protein
MASNTDRVSIADVQPYPGHGSMWFFVIGDLWLFAFYFACYIYDRANDAQAFIDGQRLLSPGIGVLNTVILLTSSLFVAICAQATRAGDFRAATRFLALGGSCGAAFMLTKGFEWGSEIRTGFPEHTNPFFLYYFVFTGLHYLHVSLGLIILVLGWRELRAARPRLAFIEATATYWHMVDCLWMTIFAVLYLMR